MPSGIAFMCIEYSISHFIVQAYSIKDTLGFCSYNSWNNAFWGYIFIHEQWHIDPFFLNARIKMQGFEIIIDSSYFIRSLLLL